MSAPQLVLVALALLGLGVALGYLLGQLRAARRSEALRAELEAVRARLESDAQREQEQRELLERSEARLRAGFGELAQETLRSNSELFLQLARERLQREQQAASEALRERETAIEQMLAPIRTALEKTEHQVQSLERERREHFGQLRQQIENMASAQVQLTRETRNLATALRRPEVRGRWGELQLRRIVELAGMAPHCDFVEQVHVPGIDGASRPDMIVRMPDARSLVIDVKTPLDAYLEAIEAQTDEARSVALGRHANQVAQRVKALGSRAYWAGLDDVPDFVILFLPGDPFLSAALEKQPELLDTAMQQNVIIATPSTLVAMLKAVAFGWRQSEVARNATIVRETGEELYRRMAAFTDHLGRVGRGLTSAVEAYNSAVGSLERSVLPGARRFTELGVAGQGSLDDARPIDTLARAPTLPTRDATALSGPAAAPPRTGGGEA